MSRTLILSISTLALVASNLWAQPPSADQVVARTLEPDREVKSGLDGYTARRRYALENIIPENYSFQMAGTDIVNDRPAYVITVTPKTTNKYLMKGRIWVDAQEYATVWIEGQPAKKPSFRTKSVQFVHTYAKQGPFWLPLSDGSVTDVRFLGATDLKIDYFGYLPSEAAAPLVEASERSLP